MSDVVAAVLSLAELPGVPEKIEAAREACTRLRWHQALRRRIPEVAAESRVRGAQASGELDGARMSVDIVRDLMRGAVTWHDPLDPVEEVMRGVLNATAETEHVCRTITSAPLQGVARLHVVAAADLLPAEALGRPRVGEETSPELTDLGPALPAVQVAGRLSALAEVIGAAGSLPGVLVGAIAHAEIATVRPFGRGNGVVARALERALVQATGLDPTGVVVPEVGHRSHGGPAYLGALTAYGTGTPAGVALWVQHCCDAIVAGAAEGTRIADAVLAGRLG